MLDRERILARAREINAAARAKAAENEEPLEVTVGRILMMTPDPTVMFPRETAGKEPGPMPAITTLLYRVCDNDQAKFEEATRLVELFILAALKEGEA